MKNGFISLHRKLMDNPVWTDPNYLKLWMYCLFSASHKEHEQLVGNQMIVLKRGQFITGRYSLTDDLNKGVKPRLRLNEKTWWRYLNNLEKWQMLTIKTTNKYSVVTIDKYDFYQSVFNKTDQQTDQQMSNSCPSDDQQMSTNNNVNKGNKKPSCPKYSTFDLEMSKHLFQLMQENNPSVKEPNFDNWANTVRLMRERDKRTEEQIKFMIEWTQNHHFWKTNILSTEKLRSQFNQLILKVKAERENKPSNRYEPDKQPRVNTEHMEKMKRLRGEID